MMCRACMCSTDKKFVKIDESFVCSYNLLTNLNITLCDGMPQYCCETCTESLNFFINFREKCITTENILRNVTFEKIKSEENLNISVSSKNSEEVIIKDEIQDDNYDEAAFFESCFDLSYGDLDEKLDNIIKNELIEDTKLRKSRRIIRNQRAKTKSPNVNIAKSKVTKSTKDNKLYCGLCPKEFKERDLLNSHVNSHKNERRCSTCKESFFQNWPMMLSHRLTHVPTSQYYCHMCPKICKSSVSLEYHYMNTHFEGENIGVTCKHCLRNYRTPRHLKNHNWNTHSGKTYICDVCSKIYSNKPALRTHLRSHSDSEHFKLTCDLCGYSCKVRTNLEQHMIRKHTPVKFKCDKCGRLFRTAAHHDKHKCNLTSSICSVCGKQFDQSRKLHRHMNCHLAEGRYKCDRCPTTYRSRSALNVHKNKHDGNRTHQCEFCPAKFYYPSVLIKHRRTHTGEKPYVCKICSRGFTGSHNLKVHMKVHGEMLVVKKTQETDNIVVCI